MSVAAPAPSEVEGPAPSGVEGLTRETLAEFPLPSLDEAGDKEDRGRLLALAGSRELAGAALLAGIGALRAGAGKLQIATAASIAPALSVAVPEARVVGLLETDEGCIAEAECDRILRWIEHAQATVVGSGLQSGPPLGALIDRLLARRFDTPLVFDAAVFDVLTDRAEQVRAWPGGIILLPHPGEMSRLIDRDKDAIVADPLGAAREAAARYGAVALVKGPVSHVAHPDGRVFRYEGGGIGLATSGSGDTLAGIVGGLAARGADPLTATLWGIYLHGEAGRALSREVGRVGFLAREILDRVPGLLP